ncbi:MAG TPA: hypothetical protein VNT56_00875 [Acidimicrobiales bacterium]|jgi:hypothetical protein|nr:hypothetical protein [Acidimicrobiales bacterium]
MTSQEKSATTRRAETRLDQATDRGGAKYRGDEGGVEAGEQEQRREAGQAQGGGPGLPAMTDGQTKGLLVGSLVGGLIGMALLVPLAFIPVSGLSLPGRLIICAIAGALAGGTAGAMYLGGRVPELEGETVDADGRPSVGSTPRDPGSDARGR